MKQYTILTKNGLNKLISAAANQTTITLSQMAVGDGSGEINQDATALQNERHRFAINAITINQNDNNILEVEGVLQADIGGFYVREAGIFCDDGSLFAIAKVAESYKPLLAEGSAKDITISFQIQVSNTNLINLKVDNNVVLATRKWVINSYYTKIECDEKFALKVNTPTLATETKAGIVKLKNTISGTAEDATLTEKALVNSFINKHRFCAYTNELNLPFGDMNTHAYWRSIKPGFYFSNLSNSGYINKPADLAHFLVLRHPDSSDVQVLCFQHPTGSVLRFMANSGYASGWQSLSKAPGENQTWQDVTSQRQANINYTNNTGSPIQVFIQAFVVQANETQKLVYIDDKPMFILHGHSGYARRSDISFIVPNGSRYKLGDGSFTCTIQNWAELR